MPTTERIAPLDLRLRLDPEDPEELPWLDPLDALAPWDPDRLLPFARELLGRELVDRALVEREPLDREPLDREPVARELFGREALACPEEPPRPLLLWPLLLLEPLLPEPLLREPLLREPLLREPLPPLLVAREAVDPFLAGELRPLDVELAPVLRELDLGSDLWSDAAVARSLVADI